METPLATALIAGGAAVLVALLSLIGLLVKNGGDRRTGMEARLDKRIDDALADQKETIEEQAEEIKTLKAQMRAVGRVLRATAEQSTDPRGPDIDPADIALLEDTEVLPPSWIRRHIVHPSPNPGDIP